MQPEFYEVYENLYREFLYAHLHQWGPSTDEYLKPATIRDLIYETQRAIDNAAEKIGRDRVRPDARYFLLVNFYEMVLRPIALVGRKDDEVRERLSRENLSEDLTHDVNLIMETADEYASAPTEPRNYWEESSAERERVREITGHSVIDAIHSAWDKIKFNEYLYWGRIT
jgi:hypothetical protein